MAHDSEKRFHSIMDKLFHAPKSSPPSASSSETQSSRGKKRPSPSYLLAPLETKARSDAGEGMQHSPAGTLQGPLCRPWDRGDLMRRLATFKSMTWFAKPKVVNAVNCAQRGWINIDMDILSCESCGARLLFSTPPSWTQQQVEKAALVFSLKLNNGHRLLCPWIDNACDESLAEFPPTPPVDLVEKFTERSFSLFQLLALPVISSSATEYMKSPQLEEFLKQTSIPEYQKGDTEYLQSETIADGYGPDSANLYYQAQKLISLCGWIPRLLPYMVECNDIPGQVFKDGGILSASQQGANGQNPILSPPLACTNENLDANESSGIDYGAQCDPKSVVLDCRLCGASVGLWAFSMVSRPLEFFRLVGRIDVNPEVHDSSCGSNVDKRDIVTRPSSSEQFSNLNITIAGGPPPTKQNFKATISLPVIGRNLRARFSYDPEFREKIYNSQKINGAESKSSNIFQEEKECTNGSINQEIILGKATEQPVRAQKDDQAQCISTCNDDQTAHLNGDVSRKDETLTSVRCTEITGGLVLQGSEQSSIPEKAENAVSDHSVVKESAALQLGDSSLTRHNKIIARNSGSGQSDSQYIATSADTGNLNKVMEFDPIRQHRHFCPWITSSGGRAPGWQQTLYALLRQKDVSHSMPTFSSSSSSFLDVDDPITSVRNLFATPKAKRRKPGQ